MLFAGTGTGTGTCDEAEGFVGDGLGAAGAGDDPDDGLAGRGQFPIGDKNFFLLVYMYQQTQKKIRCSCSGQHPWHQASQGTRLLLELQDIETEKNAATSTTWYPQSPSMQHPHDL